MGDGGGESYTRDAEILAETKKETQPNALLIETQGPPSHTPWLPSDSPSLVIIKNDCLLLGSLKEEEEGLHSTNCIPGNARLTLQLLAPSDPAGPPMG